jgi:hypothetical protein
MKTKKIIDLNKGKGVIKNFKSNVWWKAFILNSFVIAISTVIGIEIHRSIANLENKKGKKKVPEGVNALITVILVFLINFVVYVLFRIIFGFGGGMIISTKH